MTKLILSTGNIVSGGPSIIRKPGAYRSNLELTNSLRSSFLAAQQDYAAAADLELQPSGNGHENGNGNGSRSGNGNGRAFHGDTERQSRPPASVWTAYEDDALYVPRIDWSAAGLSEERSQYDITVKLFFLPTAPVANRARFAREALRLVMRELGVTYVDLLVVSFPGMSFEGDCEWEADKLNAAQGNDEEEFTTWAAVEELYREGMVKRLGISEFGSDKLARFLKMVHIRPVVDQINIKNCCNVPPPLVKLAKEKGIELLVHTDSTDILPKGTLRELLGQGLQGAGILAEPDKSDTEGLHGELEPEWVVKYTAVVSDRGVIENKGYFAGAELKGA